MDWIYTALDIHGGSTGKSGEAATVEEVAALDVNGGSTGKSGEAVKVEVVAIKARE